MSTGKPAPKLLASSVYVLVEDGTQVLPNVECKFVTEKELPDSGNYFLVTREGIAVHKDNKLISSTMPVDEIKSLASLRTRAKLRVPRIPAIHIARCHEFFQKVWKAHRAEAEVMLMFHKEQKTWEIWCPHQEVSGGHVHYETPLDELDKFRKGDEGWTWFGTIHSHCHFSAYHSGVDTDDEHNRDGIHITLGHVDGDDFSCVSSVVINGHRFQLPPLNIVEGLKNDEQRASRARYINTTQDEFFRVVLDDEQTELFYNVYEPETARWFDEKVKNTSGKADRWVSGAIGLTNRNTIVEAQFN